MKFVTKTFTRVKLLLFENDFFRDEDQFICSLMSILTGVLLPSIIHGLTGMLTGKEAVEYYAEVHTTEMNKYMHTIFMPCAVSGALLWIPALFKMDKYDANMCQTALYDMYMAHYISVDFWMGLKTSFVYYFALHYAKRYYVHYELRMIH